MRCTCFSALRIYDHCRIFLFSCVKYLHLPADLLKPVNHPLFQFQKMRIALFKVCKCLLCSFSKPGSTRHIVRSGTHTFLLSASVDQRSDVHLVAHIQKTGTLRSMDLMSADRKQIDIHLFRIDRQLSICLDCIYMEQNIRILLFEQRSCLRDRLNRSDLIIDHHHRHQNRILANGMLQILKADMAFFIHRQKRNLISLLLQKLHRHQHCRMLNRRRDQVLSGTALCICAADQCPVV